MIQSVTLRNFRILRDTTLPLAPVSLLVGPNSSGKSTAILALSLVSEAMCGLTNPSVDRASSPLRSFDRGPGAASSVCVRFDSGNTVEAAVPPNVPWCIQVTASSATDTERSGLSRLRTFSIWDPRQIQMPYTLVPNPRLGDHGANLAIVLDRLRDESPERFSALNAAVRDWFGEYDAVLFDTPSDGARSLSLRLARSKDRVPASALSEGTLFALVVLTLSMLPDPPAVCCFEEPDRGIHPRLLRRVYEALIRLAEPERFGDDRKPVQVIATTHSPYFLDLFRERPESIVIAERTDDAATFRRMTDIPHWQDILEDGGPLGEIWFSGVLGGVPANS